CPTGFDALDTLTNGLQPSDLIVLAGRPGMGKTAFALSLASNAAINFGRKVAFFSLEMDGEQLVQRILSSRAQVNLSNLRSGRLSRDDYQKINAQVQPILESKVFVDDNSDLGIMELMSKTRSLKRKSGLDLVIVDYLQLMKTGKEENRAVAIGAISRGLKILAKDLRVPVIALAQLSRKAEEKGRERPQLSDLRESGSIEQDADMVWFVERPVYRTHAEEDKYKAQLFVAKHRNGSVADIDLVFKPEFTTFYNAAPEDFSDEGSDFGDFG
ncbi:MAG TPA: AAA family ATPase, partial [Fibrobacter sp.]|nr:AAA family ATPase [Fibrobacter sp.]